MEMFRDFRLHRGKAALRKRFSRLKRTRFKGNISSAKKIGIVWDASNSDEFTVISQFHQKMLDKNIDVKVMGYYPGKELPDRLTAIRYLTCLKQEDISFTFRPSTPESAAFMNTAFDILIDANFRNLFPLQYISSLSAAGFKVGIFDNGYDHSIFDLMIELGKKKDLGSYLSEALHYLELINTGSPVNRT